MDPLRIATGVAVLLLGIPWLAADLGFSLDDVPLLGSIFQTSEIRTEPGRVGAHPAVHAGHHHGMTGVLFVLSALLLSRLVPAVAKQWLRGVLAVYVALSSGTARISSRTTSGSSRSSSGTGQTGRSRAPSTQR